MTLKAIELVNDSQQVKALCDKINEALTKTKKELQELHVLDKSDSLNKKDIQEMIANVTAQVNILDKFLDYGIAYMSILDIRISNNIKRNLNTNTVRVDI